MIFSATITEDCGEDAEHTGVATALSSFVPVFHRHVETNTARGGFDTFLGCEINQRVISFQQLLCVALMGKCSDLTAPLTLCVRWERMKRIAFCRSLTKGPGLCSRRAWSNNDLKCADNAWFLVERGEIDYDQGEKEIRAKFVVIRLTALTTSRRKLR